jgi:hypothetical protein
MMPGFSTDKPHSIDNKKGHKHPAYGPLVCKNSSFQSLPKEAEAVDAV